MSIIIIERQFDRPMSAKRLQDVDRTFGGCMRLHHVRPRLHYLALDGRRVFCVLSAPDAESVRQVVREASTPPRRLWPGSLHLANGTPNDSDDAFLRPIEGKVLVVVEREFQEPAVMERLQAIEDQCAWCLDLHRVRFLRSYFALDRRRMLCTYEAPDAESVRIANLKTGLPFERAWSATIVTPGS